MSEQLTKEVSGQRLTKITRLEIKGFKSFANKTELVFGDTYNCVIGPNGSGKSNVMDALCFVLGKGSSKEMRAEKSSNLIYNGGKLKNPAKEGEVSIFFDNSHRIFPEIKDESKKKKIEESPRFANEVKITRLIKENGQSVYKINDKPKTRQEILDLLSIAKVNPDGYNIVLQGEIIRLIELFCVL